MRLRSIEIGGYKSFGNRTELRFDSGMTAVVGPNGSGKSNIMDALRWVIGEGANRALRVKRLDDVIFTGSAERAPAGLAEVRLRLGNNDAWLGIEAAEVEVQRRIHRDGESEFRLNGRSVRLREIQELFQNSGLGAGGYALMGQGLVDEVLRLRPQERRRLIEEVADVRRHRRKMLESRRRRERAEQHLERARLLRDEIEPRLRSLERQARRARRRQELEGELNAALRAWYAAASAELTSQEQERGKTLDAAQQEQQRAETERAAAATALTTAEQTLDAARAAAAQAAGERRDAQARLNDLRHTLELEQRRRDWLTTESANLEAELGIETPDGAPAPDLERSQTTLDAAEARLRDARSLRDHILREREQAAHRRAVAEALAQRLAAEQTELRSEAESLSAALDARQAELATLETARSEAATTETAAAEALHAAREAEAGTAAQLAQIEAEERELRERRDALQREIDDLTARIAALGELVGDPTDSAADDTSAPRLLARLRVRDGYETAIEAALGVAAEAELQPSAADALSRAADALQTDQHGWIGVAPDLVAPDAARPKSTRSRTNRNGAAAAQTAVAHLTALDVINAPAKLRNLAAALLQDVLIAETIDDARSLLTAARARAVVTRDGILLRADGVVAARGAQTANRARQRRRLAEWRDRRDELQRQLDAHPIPDEQQRQRAVQLHDHAAADTAEREQTHAAAIAALAQADNALNAARADHERLQADILRLQTRLERIAAEAASAAAEPAPDNAAPTAELTAELTAEPPNDADLAALERERDEAAALFAAARARADQIERRAQAAARLEAVRAELETLRASLAEREAALAEAEAAAQRSAPDETQPQVERAEHERAQARQRVDAAQSARLTAERAAVEAAAALRETNGARQRLTASADEDGIDLAALPPPPAADTQLPLNPESERARVEQLRLAANALRERMHRLGPVQPDAAEEHEAELQRFNSITGQITDLEVTETRLRTAERELETLIDGSFRAAFDKVDEAFQRYFSLMFRGGRARLELTQNEPPPETEAETQTDEDLIEDKDAEAPPAGVDIVAQPPGKRVANLGQLSGGERALTAIALLFALLEIRPVPFCVLDEVDAALDEANVERFVQALKERAADMQFVVITHNRRTIEQADAIYGVTMASDGLSKVLSVRLDDLPHPPD